MPFSFLWMSCTLFLRGASSALGSQYSFGSVRGLWDVGSLISVPDVMALFFRSQLLQWKCLVQQMSQD